MPILFYVFWIALLTASMTIATRLLGNPNMRKIHPQSQRGSSQNSVRQYR